MLGLVYNELDESGHIRQRWLALKNHTLFIVPSLEDFQVGRGDRRRTVIGYGHAGYAEVPAEVVEAAEQLPVDQNRLRELWPQNDDLVGMFRYQFPS